MRTGKLKEQFDKLDFQVDEFMKREIEKHHMHNEDIHLRMKAIDDQVQVNRGLLTKHKQEQMILADKYENAMEKLEMSFL